VLLRDAALYEKRAALSADDRPAVRDEAQTELSRLIEPP
jgi:hypothetical protein